MDIYIAHQTAGGGGGGPMGNLSYFDKVITEALSSPSFESSFDEFWLTLNYLPVDLSPGVEVDYQNIYYTLPISRLNRRYKKIEVSLQAPEFAVHFGKKGQGDYQHKFGSENKNADVAETDLAKIVINKFIDAGGIVSAKLKDEDRFNFEAFKGILLALQQKIDSEFLITENERQANRINSSVLERASHLREERKKSNKPKDKIIRDFRVYYSGLPTKGLYPYDYQYSEIFLNLLKRKGLKCPTYHHLYILVAKTFEECLRGSTSLESWYIYGLSVIDYDRYLKCPDIEKEKIVLETIATGLKDIADIDGLDGYIIDSTIEEIRRTRLNTELIHLIDENKNHRAVVTYFSKSMEEGNPIHLTITEKSSGKSGKKLIGKAEKDQLYFWISKLTLTNTQVKIKAKKPSALADWHLKNKPHSMEFSINEIING